jgi:hypothetical protein
VGTTIRRDHVVDLVVGNRHPFAVDFDFVVVANNATFGRATIHQVAARALAIVSFERRVEVLMPFIVAYPIISFLRCRAYKFLVHAKTRNVCIPQKRPAQPFETAQGYFLRALRLTDERVGADTPFRLYGTGSVGSPNVPALIVFPVWSMRRLVGNGSYRAGSALASISPIVPTQLIASSLS